MEDQAVVHMGVPMVMLERVVLAVGAVSPQAIPVRTGRGVLAQQPDLMGVITPPERTEILLQMNLLTKVLVEVPAVQVARAAAAAAVQTVPVVVQTSWEILVVPVRVALVVQVRQAESAE